jgi:hypothetical protein
VWFIAPFLLVAIAWGAAAIWIDGPASRLVAGLLAGGFAIASIGAPFLVRPRRRGVLVALALLGAVVAWWLAIPARNDRDWIADVARPARAQIDGSQITIENVRNFDYRSDTDFSEHWETRHYDLDDLVGVDLFLSFWGPTLIAHTIVAWEFSNAPPLAISIETRKEKGEQYSAVLGFFRQYELYYVVADERDLVRVRTNVRGEHVFLYRIRMPVARARELLLDYLKTVNELAAQPAWYNAATGNCTTTIRHHVQDTGAANPWDWRILANGRLDQMLYERGNVDTSLPFAELRARSDVTEKAKAADADPAFSQRIRAGVPGFEPRAISID